ncbi:hypothetical protein BD626DRAFT_538434 [Schizophyllum amplum]|uniref:Fungal N-terminal domain-containing protein n=1 Tax=Schizophyllum amplum TaxID=97359 RepID=A0A550C7V7_9AGAR|nr:hypothetical protein BD626DRAFT_538434 [Auriculariopsis ampla]
MLFLWLIVILLVIATAYSGGKLVLGRAWDEVNSWGCEHLPWPVTSGLAWDCPSSTSNIYETQSALNDIWRSSAFTGSSSDATFAGQALSRAATADPVSREIALITELTDQLHTRLLSSGMEDLKELAIIVEEVHRTIHLIGGAVKQTAFGLLLITINISIHVTAVLALQELQGLALSQSVRACGMISSPTGVSNLADALHDQAQQLQTLLLTLRAALVSLRTQAGPMRRIQLSLAEHEENLRSTLFKLLDNAWIKVRHSVGFSTAFTRRNMHGMERVQWLQRVLADTRSSVTVIELELEAVTGHLQEIVGQISREEHVEHREGCNTVTVVALIIGRHGSKTSLLITTAEILYDTSTLVGVVSAVDAEFVQAADVFHDGKGEGRADVPTPLGGQYSI